MSTLGDAITRALIKRQDDMKKGIAQPIRQKPEEEDKPKETSQNVSG